MLIKYMSTQNNPGQVHICVCISYSVNSNAPTTPVRIYGEPYAHKFCVVDIFWNITRNHAISPPVKFTLRVRALCHDSAGDIDFDQMSLSQSEITI